MERPSWAPPEADLDHPSVARVYDVHRGGSRDPGSDRAVAPEVLHAAPAVTTLVRDNRADNRAVPCRAVRYRCGEDDAPADRVARYPAAPPRGSHLATRHGSRGVHAGVGRKP